MSTYKYKNLGHCVKGEQFYFEFTGSDKICINFMTPQQFEAYKKDITAIRRFVFTESPCRLFVSAESDIIAVADLNGDDVSKLQINVQGPFAGNLTMKEMVSKVTSKGCVLVHNADDTATDGSMIQHWIDNQPQNSRINLDKFTCPSCGCPVSRDHIHGAHVQKVRGSKWYITPTCDSCNTSKTKRLFRVAECDLVEAPNN